ncbi:MAG: hypothetical protein ABI863_03635 [Ginsengibacter sp.]
MTDLADTAKKISIDSASVTIQKHSQNNMQWNAIIHSDTLQMELSRDTIKNIITGGGDLR